MTVIVPMRAALGFAAIILVSSPAIEAVCDFAALPPSSLRPTFCITTGFFAALAISSAAIRFCASRMPSK